MTESAQRRAWAAFDGNDGAMVEIAFGPDRLRVARPTVEAWQALEAVLDAHGYDIRAGDTHGYFPRNIKGSNVRSLHAFGIAIDVNAQTNPFLKTPSKRGVRFSDKPSQSARGRDVAAGEADTDMTPAMIADIRAIRTRDGLGLFGWGGGWASVKDAMHFHIDVPPSALAGGLDWTTVAGVQDGRTGEAEPHADDEHGAHGHGGHEGHNHGSFEPDPDSEATMDGVARFRTLLELIADYEGTANRPNDGYDTSLGYGIYTGGEQPLTRMTLDQINTLQLRMLAHPKNKHDSSALGRYQIVGRTLRGLVDQLGLKPSTLYSRDLQDRLAVVLINRRGRSAANLRNEWQGLKRVSSAKILAAYDTPGPTPAPAPSPLPVPLPAPSPAPWEMPEQVTLVDMIAELLRRFQNAGGAPSRGASAIRLKQGATGAAVVELQKALTMRNYPVGRIDGVYGTLTRGAVAAFQADYDVPTGAIGSVDETTWDMLLNASSRPLSPERLNRTAADLRGAGSVMIRNADRTRILGWIASALGTLGIGKSAYTLGEGQAAAAPVAASQDALRQLIAAATPAELGAVLPTATNAQLVRWTAESKQAAFDALSAAAKAQASVPLPSLEDLVTTTLPAIANSVIPGFGGSLAAVGLGIAAHLFGSRIIERRVETERNGRSLGSPGA